MSLVIVEMKSEGQDGRYLAISFRTITTGVNDNANAGTESLAFVAVYIVNLKPVLSLSLLR
jgi:hypothetical protein